MKIRYLLVAIMMVILLVGCASKQATTSPSTVPTAPSAPQAPSVPPQVPETQPATQPTTQPSTTETQTTAPSEPSAPVLAVGSEIVLTKEGFNPAEVTVAQGSKVVITVNDDRKHAISSINSDVFRSKSVSKGDIVEIPFEKTGEFNFLDVTFGKHLKVIVQ